MYHLYICKYLPYFILIWKNTVCFD